MALSVANGSGFDIVTYDWQRDAMLKLTFGDGDYTDPAWSPDGRYVAFSASSGIFWTRSDGAGKPQRLTESKSLQWPWSFSPNGKRLAFSQFGSGTAGTVDLLTVPIESEGDGLRAGKPEGFLETTANEMYPAFSPDGRWIAYHSIEEENFEIFVRAFPDTGGKWQISNGDALVCDMVAERARIVLPHQGPDGSWSSATRPGEIPLCRINRGSGIRQGSRIRTSTGILTSIRMANAF